MYQELDLYGSEEIATAAEFKEGIQEEDMSPDFILYGAAQGILWAVGEDLEREGLLETPLRMVNAYKEMYGGYRVDIGSLFKSFDHIHKGGLVIVKDIPFYSACEHHTVPFFGTIDIGYIPNERILGLSKFKRVVDAFSQRFQVQERLGLQIAEAIQENLECKGVIVVIRAQHLCMLMRGVKSHGTETVTSNFTGIFDNDLGARNEFMFLVGGK